MPGAPVSAVIPAYDAAEHLPETLASVREQTVTVDEIVVVDDGSDDDTARVARSGGARVVRHETNRGVSAARNTGVRAARNDWVALLDADDLWKPEKIARQIELARSLSGAPVIFCDEEHVRDGEVLLPRFLDQHGPYRQVEKTRLGDAAYRLEPTSFGRALFPGNCLKPSTLLIHRELFERVGGFDERFTAPDSAIGTSEDQDFALRLTLHADPVVIEEPLVTYRRREGSLSTNEIGLKLGFAYLAEKVLSEPELYPEGAPDYFRRRKPHVLRRAAVLCMHDGDFERASEILRRSLRSRPTPRTLLAFAACLTGERGFSLLRTLKRRLELPGLR